MWHCTINSPCKGGGKLVAQAREELRWWIGYLSRGLTHRFPLRAVCLPTVILYTDAEGNGGIGGCICVDGANKAVRLYFSTRLDCRFTGLLQQRITQIIPLEAMALTVAMEVFKMHIAGSKCVFFVDNQSVLGALRRGRSRAEDIHQIICWTIDRVVQLSVMPYFLWVPSSMNLADPPSRGLPIHGFSKVDAKKGVSVAMSCLK